MFTVPLTQRSLTFRLKATSLSDAALRPVVLDKAVTPSPGRATVLDFPVEAGE